MNENCTTSLRASFLQIDDDWEAPVAPLAPTPPPLAYSEPVPAEQARSYEPQLIRDEPVDSGSTHTMYGIEVLNEPITGPGSTARARKRFRLAEHYRKVPALHPVTREPIPRTFFVLDENDNVVVPKSVSNQYEPIQNSAMDVLDDLLGPEGMSIRKGGTWKGLGIPWLYAEHEKKMEAPNGELIESGCLIQNPLGGLGSMKFNFTDINPECTNMFGAIVNGSKHSFKIRHTKSANDRLRAMKKILSKSSKHRKEVLDYLFRMKKLTLTRKSIVEIGKLSLGIDLKASNRDIGTRQGNRLEKFLEIYERGEAASPGDFYGGVQAVTNWASNHYSKCTGLEGLATTNSGLWQDKALNHLDAYAERVEQRVQVYFGQ